MNRIAIRTLTPETYERLAQGHALLHEKLAGFVPPSALSMFVAPSLSGNNEVQWTSYLSGKPVAYTDLPKDKSEALMQRLTARANVLLDAIARLRAEGKLDDSAANRLTSMVSHISADAIISVNDEPLILFWRDALTSEEASARTFLTPVMPTSEPADQAPVQPSSTHPSKRPCSVVCLWWMLGLILLLALLSLLWWLFCPLSPRNGISLAEDPTTKPTLEDFVIKIPPPTPIDPLTLWQPVPIPAAPPKPCPSPLPEPIYPACPVPAKAPEPPKPKPSAQKKQNKPVTIANAKDFCPGERPAELAPEIVIAFDHSGSMDLNINTTAAQEQQLLSSDPATQLLRLLTGQQSPNMQRLTREPRRITVAKEAVSEVVKRLPSDMHTGLVTIGNCPTASNRGFFAPSQRQQFLSEIAQTSPKGGTPLGNGIQKAGDMVDGVKRESMILVITDGRENCGSDPCAIARNLANQKPHLTINVIDIGNSGAGNCVAQAGRGRVFTANSVSELKLGIERATQALQGPKNCK